MDEQPTAGAAACAGVPSLNSEPDAEAPKGGFHSVFVDAAGPMLLLDDDRRLVDANRAACALFGLTEGSVTTRVLDELVLNAENHLDVWWREFLSLGEATCEHRVGSKARGERIVEGRYRASVMPHRHLCIATDITDRRLLEERLAQSEKMEGVGRLAGGIAHDFNNLLTVILGYIELLLGRRGPDDPARADLEEIQRAGRRAAALTQQLLAYSRKQVLRPKEVDLNETVSSLQGMLRRLVREDIALNFQLASKPAIVTIDPAQLEQVILNLVLNARDALPAGGLIRLEVARLPLSEVDVPSDQPARSAEYVRLRVIDDGVGMTREVRAHLFEPFFTTKEIGKGTGLGLASAYGIVRQSNGFIGVVSEPGLGATFTMHFPVVAVPEATRAHQAPQEELTPSGGHETILLVEDEDAVRHVITTVLRRQGYHVLDAATSRQANELFEQHAGPIDLLLTDIVMPEMNGPALAQHLVAARPELRVLFMSGYAGPTFNAANPHLNFLGKPFHASELAAKVREALSKPRSGDHPGAKE
jgi:two-component system cell cycle sensor histidine kinase/response regulator CckA